MTQIRLLMARLALLCALIGFTLPTVAHAQTLLRDDFAGSAALLNNRTFSFGGTPQPGFRHRQVTGKVYSLTGTASGIANDFSYDSSCYLVDGLQNSAVSEIDATFTWGDGGGEVGIVVFGQSELGLDNVDNQNLVFQVTDAFGSGGDPNSFTIRARGLEGGASDFAYLPAQILAGDVVKLRVTITYSGATATVLYYVRDERGASVIFDYTQPNNPGVLFSTFNTASPEQPYTCGYHLADGLGKDDLITYFGVTYTPASPAYVLAPGLTGMVAGGDSNNALTINARTTGTAMAEALSAATGWSAHQWVRHAESSSTSVDWNSTGILGALTTGITADVSFFKADYYLISLGTNDAKLGTPTTASAYNTNISARVAALLSTGKPILLICPPYFDPAEANTFYGGGTGLYTTGNGFIDQYYAQLVLIAAANPTQVHVVDLRSMAMTNRSISVDGIHYATAAAGQASYTALVLAVLQPLVPHKVNNFMVARNTRDLSRAGGR